MVYKPHVLSQFGIGNEFNTFKKQVCIFLDGLWFDSDEFKNSEVKVFVGGCEPDIVLDSYYTPDTIIKNKDKFDLILTRHQEVVDQCDNAKLFPFGTSWITPSFKKLSNNFEISFLCGTKKYLPGHILRHNIFRDINKVNTKDLTFKLNMTVDKKERIFETSQYSVIVENSQCKNYFTEKLIDCLITKTIPLYWGCPNIDSFFDKRGIITFNSIEELYKKVKLLTPTVYNERLDAVEKNFKESLKYRCLFSRVNNEIKRLISGHE